MITRNLNNYWRFLSEIVKFLLIFIFIFFLLSLVYILNIINYIMTKNTDYQKIINSIEKTRKKIIAIGWT